GSFSGLVNDGCEKGKPRRMMEWGEAGSYEYGKRIMFTTQQSPRMRNRNLEQIDSSRTPGTFTTSTRAVRGRPSFQQSRRKTEMFHYHGKAYDLRMRIARGEGN
ncbi:MAG: hypothetical protein ACE5G0_17510, partial [Rhodothermales bacterium]